MPSYTTLTTGSKTRILRVCDKDDATVVTTLNDKAIAKNVAQLLTANGADLPWLVSSILAHSGINLPDPTQHEYDASRSRDDWLEEPAYDQPVDVTRRALAEYDHVGDDPRLSGLHQIAAVLTHEPDPVRRAIRDEVASWMAPYDTVPVVGYAYDRKYDRCSWSVLLTGGLAFLSDQRLEDLIVGDGGRAIDALDDRGEVEVPAGVYEAADEGLLTVAVHPGQLLAWLRQNRPALAEKYAHELSLEA